MSDISIRGIFGALCVAATIAVGVLGLLVASSVTPHHSPPPPATRAPSPAPSGGGWHDGGGKIGGVAR